jgi:hypothetical protein
MSSRSLAGAQRCRAWAAPTAIPSGSPTAPRAATTSRQRDNNGGSQHNRHPDPHIESWVSADKQIGRLRLFRMLGAVLLALGAAVVAFFSLPRLARDHMDRVRLSATMMGVLRWYNGTRLKRAGTARSATAILTHVGRRSGRTYETPLGAAAYGDGLVVSLAYGPGTDWCRNVMATGTGTLAWKGQTRWSPIIRSGPYIVRSSRNLFQATAPASRYVTDDSPNESAQPASAQRPVRHQPPSGRPR